MNSTLYIIFGIGTLVVIGFAVLGYFSGKQRVAAEKEKNAKWLWRQLRNTDCKSKLFFVFFNHIIYI